MSTNLLSLLTYFVNLLPELADKGGFLGTLMAWVMAASAGLSATVTAINLVWHAVIKLLQALALMPIPGATKLKTLADFLTMDEEKLENWEKGYLLPILNLFSNIIPVPSAKKVL